jgi:AraC-like DNA-binding protein
MATRDGATFTDVEDFVGAVQEARIELVVTSPGVFWARLTRVTLPHLHLLALSESLPRTAYVALRPERVCVTYPLRSGLSSVWGGVRLQRGHIVFHSRGELFHQRTNGPAEWGLLSLEPKRLAAAGRTLTGLNLVPPPSGRILRPARHDIAHLLQLHAAVTRLADKQPKLILNPEVIRGMQHDLTEAVVCCLASEGESDLGGWQRHKQVMDRFEHVLATRPARQMPVAELCAATGVSERALRSCCAEFLGISPSRYLRLRRLRLAHIALRSDGSIPINVAEVARRYGFSELGRFAGIYHDAFGEAPSTTLLRAKKSASAKIFSEFG